MAQAAFEFSPLVQHATQPGIPLGHAAVRRRPGPAAAAAPRIATDTAATDLDATGFEIGWDHAHHRLTPPLRHLHDHNPVRQGWSAGRAVFGSRMLKPTVAVRQWLGLRLQAWQQGAVFEGVQVNPHFLARIDGAECPVSRQPLTLCAGRPGDACISRLNLAAAYAAGNLVVLSQRVADVHQGADAACQPSPAERPHEPGQPGQPAASPLSADESARLGVLASFATPLPHAQAALLALRVLPPNRVRVINPVQALQVMLTLQFTQAGYARRLLGLAVLMPGSEVRQAFLIFMHTLLARRLSAGQAPTPLALRRAMEDSWADALVNRRWQRLATRLSAADCERLLQRAGQRGLAVGGSRWLSADSATDGWALSARRTCPVVPAVQAVQAVTAAAAGPVSGIASPGIARSLGSQKRAS